MKTYVYIHACTINNWREVLEQIYTMIVTTPHMYDELTGIRIYVLGSMSTIPEDAPYVSDPKVEIFYTSNDIMLFERPTLTYLYNDAQDEDFYVLYLHTKGVRHNNTNPNVLDWVNYLLHYNITNYKMCLFKLMQHDVVGVNLQLDPFVHFSGNFFWTKSSHLRNLNTLNLYKPHYNAPEFWICSIPGSYCSLYNSGVNHYHEPYPPSNYNGSVFNFQIHQK